MSYDIHIERLDDAGERVPIALEEWEALVEREPDLRIDHQRELTATNPSTGESMTILADPGRTAWSGHPDGERWLHFRSSTGSVYARSPDDLTIARMRELARALGARVRGDEGESYDVPEPADPRRSRRPPPRATSA